MGMPTITAAFDAQGWKLERVDDMGFRQTLLYAPNLDSLLMSAIYSGYLTPPIHIALMDDNTRG